MPLFLSPISTSTTCSLLLFGKRAVLLQVVRAYGLHLLLKQFHLLLQRIPSDVGSSSCRNESLSAGGNGLLEGVSSGSQ